jgi:hypothetical protein
VARLAVGLAAALVVVGIGALLFSHLAVPTPGASGTTPSTTGDACLSPPATWDPRHASATQIASYGLPPRPPDSDPTAVSKWVQIVSHAKHRACGPGQVGNPVPATPSGQELSASAAIEFDSGISYSTALRTITDLGLELADLPCPNGTEFIAGTPTRWQIWSPLAHPDDFTGNAAFIAFATPLAPTDWLHAIVAAPGVKDVRTDLSYNCPADVLATPPSGTLLTLGVSQPPAYARLIFGAGVSYDAALLAVSNLGLRLADPCREQVLAAGHGYPWQPAGQESAYAATHALMLASSEAASAQWQTQARALSGVTAVEVAPPITCPAG